PAISTFDIHHFHLAKFDRLIAPQLIAADLQELRRRRAVAGKKSVEDAGRFIAWMPCIAHKDAAQTSTEHERRAQTRWPATDHDGVENFRVGKARRMRCYHNSDLKSSATAEDENQDERAHNGNDQGTDAPKSVGEE